MEFRVPTLRETLGIVYTDFFLEKHHFLERVLEFSKGFVVYIFVYSWMYNVKPCRTRSRDLICLTKFSSVSICG